MIIRIFVSIVTLSIFLIGKSQAQEKIHLHLDKDIYLPGETIWFKAYLFYNNQPSFLSTNFYLAVYDDEGKLLHQKHYPIFGGTCNGNIALPDTLTTNTLRLRAVTKGLLLADSSNYYERTVTVFKKNKTTPTVIIPDKNITLEFLPEGGNAIAGLQNVIVVKATFDNEAPAQISGKITENVTGVFIDSFYTNTNGLGKILLLPEAGKTYSAIWQGKSNTVQTTTLVSNTANGVLFHFEKVKNILYCNVLKNSSELRYRTLKLAATWGNEEVLNATLAMEDKVQWINKNPLDSLPEGIIQFTLFDRDGNILQQQIILNSNVTDTKKPLVKILQKNLTPKGENVLELEMPDSLLHNISISVADLNFYDMNNRINIKQNLWLSQDVLPNKQLTKTVLQQQAITNLELLLVAAKTIRFKGSNPNPLKPLDNFLLLQAKYKNKNYALPKESNLILIKKDTIQGNRFYKLSPASQLSFIKEGVVFFDSAQVNYQLDKNKKEVEFIKLSTYNNYIATPLIARKQFIIRDTTLPAVLNNSETTLINFADSKPKKFNEVQTIKEVVIKSRYKNPITMRLQELDQKYTTGMFSGLARGYQLNVLDDKNAWAQSDVLNYIAYRVPSLRVISIRGERFIVDAITKGKILAFVNEVELPEQTGISSISMTQVAYIKYIPGIVIGSSFVSSGGVLYIYTKKGDEVEVDNSIGMRKIKLKGYDIAQAFTTPDYTDKKNLLSTDMRTTLYWNPYLISDKVNNKIEIKFNNNDVSKKLLLTIEGFTEEGKLIHIEKVIEN